jgi:uncharacterized protein (DUF362 family)
VTPSSKGVVALVRGEPSYEAGNARELIEQALALLGNPFDEVIQPGQTVLIKPNLIASGHAGRPYEWVQIITNPSILEAVIDLVAERVGDGSIIIADAPQTDSDWDGISARLALPQLLDRVTSKWPQITVEAVDLRREHWIQRGGVTVDRVKLPGDPRGAVLVDLGDESEFADHSNNHEYYGADYDYADTRDHHRDGRHEYLISKSVLSADVFINLPKLKTHKKAGVTLSLKNLVGINADKNYLPHYSLGAPSAGGDEFPDNGGKRRFESWASRSFKKVITKAGGRAPLWGPMLRKIGTRAFGSSQHVVRSGNWWGNDTIWRMCLDLNKILLWFDGEGHRRATPRPYFSIVDGIVAGEGDGPVSADAVDFGVIVAGTDPVSVDHVCTRAIGFDWRLIPILSKATSERALPIGAGEDAITVVSNEPAVAGPLSQMVPFRRFEPHFGWRGHIELDDSASTSPSASGGGSSR